VRRQSAFVKLETVVDSSDNVQARARNQARVAFKSIEACRVKASMSDQFRRNLDRHSCLWRRVSINILGALSDCSPSHKILARTANSWSKFFWRKRHDEQMSSRTATYKYRRRLRSTPKDSSVHQLASRLSEFGKILHNSIRDCMKSTMRSHRMEIL
jgi:tRNA G37 N-methylase Trm5